MSKYSVAIIGCGSIGALKNDQYDQPGGDAVLTHAHAFWQHPQTDLHLLVDADIDKAIEAAGKWTTSRGNGVWYPAYCRDKYQTDIIVVATPTATHRDVLMEVLDLRPKLVVAEKPFCQTLKEAREVHDAYAAAKIPVLVDYIRRFDPITGLKLADLRNGNYGKILHARCLYGRGLRRDGCHGLDIFNWVLGEPTGLFIDHGRRVDDGADAGDASYNVTIDYGAVKAQMVPVDSRLWGAFEVEFVCEKAVVSFPNWGKYMATRTADDEETFGQYKALGWPVKLEATALTKALFYLADNCVKHLDGLASLLCTSRDAVRVHEILDHVDASGLVDSEGRRYHHGTAPKEEI